MRAPLSIIEQRQAIDLATSFVGKPQDQSRPTYKPCDNYNPTKNLGCPCDKAGNSPDVGNPINIATGSKYQEEQDFSQDGLSLLRYYNSAGEVRASHNGLQWLNNYDRTISFSSSSSSNSTNNPSPPTQVTVRRPDGRELVLKKVSGTWHGDADVDDQLTEIDDGKGYVGAWTLLVADTGYTENYSANGILLSMVDHGRPLVTLSYTDGTQMSPSSGIALAAGLLWKVTDARGRSLGFDYDSMQNLVAVTLPDGGVIGYGYNPAGYLTSVSYPGGKTRQYLYDEASYSAAGSNQGKLTGIVDENGARYATFNYQADGRAISTQHGNGADLNSVSYASSGTAATVTYPLGQQATATFVAPQGTAVISNMSGNCGTACGQQYQSQTLDANGYPAAATDFNGNVTKTAYDVNGLLGQQIEASGTTSQRTTNTTWNTTLRVPLTRTVLDANGNTVSNSQWVYNSSGQTLARCEIDPTNSAASGYTCSNTGTVPAGVRRWTYTYCTAVDTTQCPIVGLMLTATGPRTDTTQTTTYSYYLTSSATSCGTPGAACYQAGDLHTITDPAGHVTTIASYDADGRVTRLTDANGLNTDTTYTPRGWVASRNVGGATSKFTYTPYGAVQTVTDPDSVTTTYGYDAAHRLVKITDAQGNYLQYTLDAASNKTAEQVYDSTGTLHKSLSRTFNPLGQLTKVMDGLSHTVFDASASNSYDSNGNLVQSADGLGIQRQQGYDALNRLVQTLDNYNGAN
ncbi:hypothetical protein EKH80_20845 [Dyella choica]|uniref:DUF6531 domain-containing protein n=2 Tax=Dyella choica TaxID=1927959 RepID=A0A432M0H3_9GAMM|nr:hypothetical protein EKH80_20845 [Dyella choica]